MNSGANVLEFCKYMGKLKHLKRTGWVIRDISEPETVASHMYRMAMLTFLLENRDEVDTVRCLKMALVHDMAESIVGDITPHCGVAADVKHRMEEEAMEKIVQFVPDLCREELKDLFNDYETQNTAEAKLVKDLDRFDMICQAYEYEEAKNHPGHLQEFFDATEGSFKHPEVQKWVAELKAKRAKFLADSQLVNGTKEV